MTSSNRAPRTSSVVPIRSLGRDHLGDIESHLLALEPHDRYLRFGYAANDEQIGRYVERLLNRGRAASIAEP